jgi:hypothetical protein
MISSRITRRRILVRPRSRKVSVSSVSRVVGALPVASSTEEVVLPKEDPISEDFLKPPYSGDSPAVSVLDSARYSESTEE